MDLENRQAAPHKRRYDLDNGLDNMVRACMGSYQQWTGIRAALFSCMQNTTDDQLRDEIGTLLEMSLHEVVASAEHTAQFLNAEHAGDWDKHAVSLSEHELADPEGLYTTDLSFFANRCQSPQYWGPV